MNSPVSTKVLGFGVGGTQKNFPTKKTWGSDFTTGFYQTSKEMIPNLHTLQENKRKEHFPAHSMRPIVLW